MQTFISSRGSRQKNVLGFFGFTILFVLGICACTVVQLAGNNNVKYLIPWIAAFVALIIFTIVLGVLSLTFIDPSKLVLVSMTGPEYTKLQQQQIIRGDSNVGLREYKNQALSQNIIAGIPEGINEGEIVDGGFSNE